MAIPILARCNGRSSARTINLYWPFTEWTAFRVKVVSRPPLGPGSGGNCHLRLTGSAPGIRSVGVQ